jgi:hypothetical protein
MVESPNVCLPIKNITLADLSDHDMENSIKAKLSDEQADRIYD